MRITIADKLSAEAVTALEALGLAVEFRPELGADDLPAALAETDILVVRSTRVTTAALAAAPRLSLVVRAGAGVNTIDVTEASRRGVYVANCPGRNAAAVAELAIGLLIAADRRIVEATVSLRAGAWRKKVFGQARGLQGRTLGILGFGAIGRAVAVRAAGLGMEVVVWSRSMTPELARVSGVGCADSPLDLAGRSDAVSVHLAATDATRHTVDAPFLAALPDGGIVINTSRGDLVDTAALRAAIVAKGLRVGLDVFEEEPAGGEAKFDQTELANLVTATPHIGASTAQASAAIADEVVRIVKLFLASGKPPGAVNLCDRSPATHHLVVRHYNRVGVLAGILDELREEEINVEEMENTIFEGAHAACCTLLLDAPPSLQLLEKLRARDEILHLLLESHGP